MRCNPVVRGLNPNLDNFQPKTLMFVCIHVEYQWVVMHLNTVAELICYCSWCLPEKIH